MVGAEALSIILAALQRDLSTPWTRMHMNTRSPRRCAITAVVATLLLGTSASTAVEADDWTVRATLYLWGAGISGETAGGADVDMGFDQLIENLDFGFMGAFEARRQRWSVGADLLYLNVGVDDGSTVPLRIATGDRVNLDVSAKAETKGWVVTPRAGYNVLDTDRVRLDALLGARYLDLEVDLDLGLQAGRFSTRPGIAASVVSWDAIAGAKGHVKLDDGWSLPYYADIGTGESELTWQLAGGVAYSFRQAEVALWYRHMAWEFDDGDALSRISFSGPMLSGSWWF
jgi:hypothetical protein